MLLPYYQTEMRFKRNNIDSPWQYIKVTLVISKQIFVKK